MGRRKIILPIGTVIGKWTVLEESDFRGKAGARGYICCCECGTKKWVSATSLVMGKSKSCGCLSQRYRQKGTPEALERGRKLKAAAIAKKEAEAKAKATGTWEPKPRKGKPSLKPYRPKDISIFGYDEWMFKY